MLAAIALGSNLPSEFGDPAATLREAIRRLGSLGRVVAVSRFYDTAPVGYVDQPRFLNAALLLETTLEPVALLRELLGLERAMGRVRGADQPAKGPRSIDLDLLLVERAPGQPVMMATPELVLPHPEMHRRAFVLEPLAEIAGEIEHPTLHRSVAELAANLVSSV